MSTNVDDLDDNALEALQAAEDAQTGNLEVTDEDEDKQPESEAPAAVADEPAAPTEPEPTETDAPKVAGVASKDGTRVLPYAALQAERRAARHERSARERAESEAAALRQQLQDLRDGKTPDPVESSDELSEGEIEAVAADFPQVGKALKQLQALKAQVAKLSPKDADPEPAAAEPADDPIQEAIDAVPALLEWQTSDPEKFARAQVLDNVAKTSPKWRGKPLHERFEHVAKQVADEFDIPFEGSTRTSTPNKVDPKTAISKAARAAPNTLSDLKGGAVDQTDDRVDRLPPSRAMARMQDMSDAEIERHLAKFG